MTRLLCLHYLVCSGRASYFISKSHITTHNWWLWHGMTTTFGNEHVLPCIGCNIQYLSPHYHGLVGWASITCYGRATCILYPICSTLIDDFFFKVALIQQWSGAGISKGFTIGHRLFDSDPNAFRKWRIAEDLWSVAINKHLLHQFCDSDFQPAWPGHFLGTFPHYRHGLIVVLHYIFDTHGLSTQEDGWQSHR